MKLINLKYFNLICDTKYTSINSLIFNPPSVEKEMKIRNFLTGTNYDLTPIIVLDEISDKKLSIELNAKTYEDVKEKLIIL